MHVAIIHLSDLHLKGEGHANPLMARGSALASAIVTYLPSDIERVFVVVSGDIAFSGRSDEYAVAAKLLESLRSVITDRVHKITTFLLVPGNHDLDHQVDPPGARNLIIENMSAASIDQSIIDTCLGPQKQYSAFATAVMSGTVSQACGLVREWWHADSDTVLFRLVNSAWMSTGREAQGRLRLPSQIFDGPRVKSNAKVVITVLHHPLNWFEADNARRVLAQIEASSDIVLTGHEHDPGMTRRERPSGVSTDWIEGGVLQDYADEQSSFNIVDVDLVAQVVRTQTLRWNATNRLYEPEDLNPRARPFRRNVGRLKGQFALADEFSDRLSEAMPCVHPTGTRPKLDDLFVYPDLRPSPLGGDRRSLPVVGDPVAYVLKERYVIIAGVSQSGKSSLLRSLFRDLRERGVIPVLLDAAEIRSGAKEKVLDLVRKEFAREYTGTTPEAYIQRDPAGKAVLIDDWQNCNLGREGRFAAVRALVECFGVVVLVAGDELAFEDTTSHRAERSPFHEFRRCELLPLGHRKRDMFIERWYELGQTHADDEVELAQRAARAAQAVSTALGRGLPCYPPWLLIWLQGIDANSADPRHVGSQGYLYQALITLTLRNASRGRVQDDVLLNYLSELANEIYVVHATGMSRREHLDWHYEFNRRYALVVDLKMIRDILEKAGTLVVRADESIQFKFRGVLNYFVARFLADRIGEPTSRQRVQEMAARIHEEDAVGILNSLAYLTKDPFVIEALIEQARTILSAVPSFDLVSDTKFVPAFSVSVQEIVIEEHDARESRRALLDQRDAEERLSPESRLEEERPPGDPIFTVLASLRMIEVLGQVLRNFYGSIVAERKVEIAEECFLVGLRLLKWVLDSLQRDPEGLALFVFETLRHENPDLEREKLREESRGFVQRMAYGVGLGIVRHMSRSLGHESLEPVFEQLGRKKILAYDVVAFSVELDHYRAFPFGTLEKLKGTVKRKVPYAMSLLQNLVWQHLYVFPMTRGNLQRAWALAELPSPELHPIVVRHSR